MIISDTYSQILDTFFERLPSSNNFFGFFPFSARSSTWKKKEENSGLESNCSLLLSSRKDRKTFEDNADGELKHIPDSLSGLMKVYYENFPVELIQSPLLPSSVENVAEED